MKKIKSIVDNILKIETVMGIVVLGMITLISCNMPKIIEEGEEKLTTYSEVTKKALGTIVIDPGHGGADPGKIGVNGEKEKDINLSISLILRDTLVSKGYNVVMTRCYDQHLNESESEFNKREDLDKRCQVINNAYVSNPSTIVISIHQNSFTQESAKGPQVFYYGGSDRSRSLAEIMQKTMNESLRIEKPRKAKENNDYYMLVKTKCPAVIVECGFLSNTMEAKKLGDIEYQKQICETILSGIQQYTVAISPDL